MLSDDILPREKKDMALYVYMYINTYNVYIYIYII